MKKVSFIASVAALLLPLGALAESHEEEQPAPLSDVWIVVPKSGMEAEFAEAAAAHMAFRADAGENRQWMAYRVAVGHNLTPIQFRSCCFNYADIDAHIAEDEEKGLSANWNANVNQYVDHYHHYLEDMDWEYSHWPEEGTDGPYFGVTSWTWKQGAGPAADEARKKLSELALNEGWAKDDNNWLWHSRMAGKPKLMIVSSFSSFADMEEPEPSFYDFVSEQAGAEEAAELFTTFGAAFADSDYSIWEHDPALSTPSDDE